LPVCVIASASRRAQQILSAAVRTAEFVASRLLHSGLRDSRHALHACVKRLAAHAGVARADDFAFVRNRSRWFVVMSHAPF